MFAHCPAPIWRGEDLTACFRRDFLGVLFPLTVCFVSLLHLAVTLSQSLIPLFRRSDFADLGRNISILFGRRSVDTLGYASLPEASEVSRELLEPREDDDVAVFELSRPRAPVATIVLEALCLFGEAGITVAMLVTTSFAPADYRAETATLLVWVYLILLCLARLYLQIAKLGPFVRLWDHSAFLYCSIWFPMAINFRSILIHPLPSQLSQNLSYARFGLVSGLATIILSVRRGNRDVLLVGEHNAAPSQEPLASLASIVTFSWFDSFVWKGWQRPLEMEDVWNLLPQERAAALLKSFRRHSQTAGLTFRLVKHFKWDLLYQQFWAVVSAASIFVPTLLLKAILEYVEDPTSTSAATAWLWVTLLPLVACLTAIAEGQSLFRGRKICIKIRAIVIGEIYAKTLRRKAASSADTDMNSNRENKKPHNGKKGGLKALWKKLVSKSAPATQQDVREEHPQQDTQITDTQVNSGTILNLMSVDSYRVGEIGAYIHFLFPMVPVELFVAITLLFRVLGWSAVAGIGVMIAVFPLNIIFSRKFSKVHKRIMAATDRRIHTTNEVLQNVRIIKFFAWEDRFANGINEKRRDEIAAIRYRFGLWACASVIWFGVPLMITMVSFFLYTVVEGKPLVPSIAFTALSLFSLLRYPLDRFADMLAHVLESRVSIGRIERFLNEEETGKYEQLSNDSHEINSNFVGFKNATCSWGPHNESLEDAKRAFRLVNLDINFKTGGLNVVIGPTGSGKTSLLMALLGEMTLIAGRVSLPGGYDRGALSQEPDGLTESVAYCAQQAWLVNDTIKQNILFASPYDEARYKQVIEACALQRDLEVFESGDATLVGEKGVVVSGGQKQRISLARALYSSSRHILLDDCLSAVDSYTAQHIVKNCVVGPLMENRTCILVTHNVGLCIPHADHVVVLKNGKISSQGSSQEILASGILGEEVFKSREDSANNDSQDSETGSATEANGQNGHHKHPDTADKSQDRADSKLKRQADVDVRKEAKAVGSVDFRVILLYLRAMGRWYIWAGILAAYALENLANVSTNIWIRQWANSYATQGAQNAQGKYWVAWASDPFPTKHFFHPTTPGFVNREQFSMLNTDETYAAQDTEAVGYYLGIYGLLSLAYILISLVRLGILFKGSLNASRSLHTRLLNAVLRAKFKFFDTTPLGQIMNRFSKDMQAIDQDIAPVAAGFGQCFFSILVIIVLISVITPGFLIPGVFLTMIYFAIGAFYLETSRDLKRLESTQRSPLYQQFGETLSGIITIRAYGDERRFIDDNARRINMYNRPFIYLWSANRWLGLRVDFAGALVSFFAAVFVVSQAKTIDPGAAGLSLTYALGFNESVLWLVRTYAENEQNMNHIERVKEFLEVEQEAPAHLPENKPSGSWPSRGAVRFEKYTTRYRSDLEPVLFNLNFDIKGEEKIGIVGRTGAGKSSLALALFRGLEADSGRILIDDVDIATIGLQDLRENLTVVPQDPTLFTGTIRSNLDPFGLFTDEEIFTALRRVHLIGSDTPRVTARLPAPYLGNIDEASEAVEEVDYGTATGDLSAPGPMRRASMSSGAGAATGEEAQRELSRVTTNPNDNANIFLDLSSPVAESGTNLSQGQRQLLCLARALLKAPRVLLMDEATASIDYDTDAKIQETLREIQGSTLITIAHRLQTIVDYDKVLVLEAGEVAEFGPPWELIHVEKSIFRGMCERSGDFDILLAAAEKAEHKRRLIDVDS